MDVEKIPFGENEAFNVLIEIPKDSPEKYEYNEETQLIEVDFIFKDGFVFSYNYGLIPQTKAQDGDHLDAMVLNEEALKIGEIVPCRAIGMIEMIDRGEEDHKIIAVPVNSENYKNVQSIQELPENWQDEARVFYAEVARQKNKIIEIKSFPDKERALAELEKCKIK